MDTPRKRIRELGITPGILPTGQWNAITDVADAKVGPVTLIEVEVLPLYVLAGFVAARND